MPNYGYHLARARGRAVRSLYRICLPLLAPVKPSRNFPLEVFAYSGEAALPEQAASIRSFLRHVGRPTRFNVISDGTYSLASRQILERLDSCISVGDASQWIPKDLPEAFRPYLTKHPTGRQLALIMSLPLDSPVLYCDSDIRFFAGAADIYSYLERADVPAFYQADCQFSGDERLLRDAVEKKNPVNTGFLLLFRKLDWSLSLERLGQLDGDPTFFTNQTMTHLTMHANAAAPFAPRKYVLRLDDQFIYPDRYADAGIALRHYVNPVRHKFWMTFPV
jgi:hypothetical protein